MKKRKKYPEHFKRDVVRRALHRGTKTMAEIAKETGVSTSQLYRWLQQFGPKEQGSSAVEDDASKAEIENLRKRLRKAEAENYLLKKAAALFAKEVR